jgi:hypothetical protein
VNGICIVARVHNSAEQTSTSMIFNGGDYHHVHVYVENVIGRWNMFDKNLNSQGWVILTIQHVRILLGTYIN